MLRVIKIGGSLLDWPDLPVTLHRWLNAQAPALNVLICGGGQLADCIRAADQRFELGDERAHWLAVDCMSITTSLLATACHFETPLERYDDLLNIRATNSRRSIVFNVCDFLRTVEPRLPGAPLPHNWTATSDSIAARLAQVLQADQLVLLKSSSAPAASLADLATLGYVDSHFPQLAAAVPPSIFINLKDT